MKTAVLRALCGSATLLVAVAEDPVNAVNLTVYHINPLSALADGGSPIDMDTADPAGDFYFDMLEEYVYPLECPHGSDSPGAVCQNREVAAPDLVVTKLTLAAAQPFGSYARCNLCVNHTDHYHHTCEDGTYFCFPLVNNYTVGYQNVSHGQSETRWNECTSKTSTWECQLLKLPWKMTSDHPGAWYSTQREGMCSDAPAPAPSNSTCLGVFPTILELNTSDPGTINAVNASSPEECCSLCGTSRSVSGLPNCTGWSYRAKYVAEKEPPCQMTSLPPTAVYQGTGTDFSSASGCAWRTLSVDKIVNASCQRDYFLSGVENASSPVDKQCFTKCGGVPGLVRNQSTACWAYCFYSAVMGPDAGTPNGTVGGIPLDTILDIWERPLQPDFDQCPDIRAQKERHRGQTTVV
eukprot:INCI3269.2.p1 GENE.INCI3269.2~~INCI3269.2.p1  ORF type:complete len:464 (-),score=57.28 INCI3269.2:404-1627(-)